MTRPNEIRVQFDGEDCFLIYGDIKIARREAGEWISLEPGYTVLDGPSMSYFEVSYQGVRIQ